MDARSAREELCAPPTPRPRPRPCALRLRHYAAMLIAAVLHRQSSCRDPGTLTTAGTHARVGPHTTEALAVYVISFCPPPLWSPALSPLCCSPSLLSAGVWIYFPPSADLK